MTVSTLSSSATMLGTGAATTFNFSFNNAVPSGQTASQATYTLIYTDTTGAQTTIASTAYTLTFTAATTGALWGVGGTVLYPTVGSPIASGTTLTLTRTFPLTQTTTISNQGDFAPQVIEEMGDILEMQIQQISQRTTQWRGTWVTPQIYNVGDIVQDGANGAATNSYYICLIGNTSGTWLTDLAAGYWTISTYAIPVTNQTITLSGAVTGTGAQAITTSFGTLAATSFLANIGTATGAVSAFSLTAGKLAGRGSTGGLASITPNTGLAISGTNLNNTGVVVVNPRTFSVGATYTPTTGMLYCDVQMWGAGGGGGGSSGVNGSTAAGGGAGGYSRKLFAAAAIGAGVAVVIGAGGAGGANSGATGANGATCSFANVMFCIGGVGGTGNTSASTSVQGASGGGASGGDVNITGQGGFNSVSVNSTTGNSSGAGGSSALGGAGRGLLAALGAASDASSNSGSGGGGAASSGSAVIGGVGGSGFCLITEYCT